MGNGKEKAKEKKKSTFWPAKTEVECLMIR